MSKSRTRLIFALLALTFWLAGTSIVAEARDGMPKPRPRVPQRHFHPRPPTPPRQTDRTPVDISGPGKNPPPLNPGKPPGDRSDEDFGKRY